MALKGGTLLLLLIVACAVLAERPGSRPYFKDQAKQLMKRCQEKGYPVPNMELVKSVFDDSDSPMEGRDSGQTNTVQSTFMNLLESVSDVKGPHKQLPMGDSDKMTNMLWNCTKLVTMIKEMKNSSEASACYMHAFVAPVSWEMLSAQSENMDLDNYDMVLWGAEPVLQGMPTTKFKLPPTGTRQQLKRTMKTLRESYGNMTENQRNKVGKWVIQQIPQNYHNCTMMPSSDARFSMMERCKSTLKWLDDEVLAMMGPYLSHLEANNVDSSPKEKLCEFFRSEKFKSALRMVTKMNPSLTRRFLQRFQECFSGKDFAENLDKLGPLACHLNSDVPDLTPDISRKLLSELNNCDNPRIKKLKRRLVRSIMSNQNTAEALSDLGNSVALLPPRQLAEMVGKDFKKFVKGLVDVQLTQGQMRALVRKALGNKKCKKISHEELIDLQSLAEGLPNCVLKHINAQEILNDTETLKNISKRMRRGQLKAMLQGLREDMNNSELVQMLPDCLLRILPVSDLEKSNITSLDQVEDTVWRESQAAFLAKKMHDLGPLKYRQLRSVLRGVTCKMINKVGDTDVQEMAEGITETPQWLPKVLARCAARKLFASLEKERADYFKTITEEEMVKIPTPLLLHLPPLKVKDLPASVCSILLDKMEMADLSLLPHRDRSRPAFTQRALLCLANGTDLSRLTTEDVSRLGPLLCELKPSQLQLMAPDVLNSSLQDMASCQHIPQGHMPDLIQLVNQTFGDPSDWSEETMEKLGPLLLWDDNATSALPNKPWLKDVLYYLKEHVVKDSDALNEKIFSLATTTSNPARKKREANNNNGVGNSGSSTTETKVPTEDLIEEMGPNNVFWTDAELDQMSEETFLATVEILGNISDYSADQLAVLSKKAIKAFGPVSEMNESVVAQMGCITQGFSNADLEMLPFSLDTLEQIAHCGWNESQIESVWKGAAKHNNLNAQQLESAEMVSLNRFICGLNSSEIAQLNMDAFKDAVGSMNDVECSFEVAQQLKSLAVSAFGDPSTWTEVQVSDLGNIIAGLEAKELASLEPSVFSFISESCIPLIPPNNFAALTVAQLEALGPDNADMVTSEQRAAMTAEQLAALDSAAAGPRVPLRRPLESRASSLSVEGVSAYVKPLLFFLTMFLLL